MSFHQISDHLKNADLLEAKRGWYTILQFQLRMCKNSMVGKLQHGILNRCENQAFFNYFHSKLFFFILVHVCFTFREFITKIECQCKYSNHFLVFWIGNKLTILASTYLESTGRKIILCVKMLLLRDKSHVLISMIKVEIEM